MINSTCLVGGLEHFLWLSIYWGRYTTNQLTIGWTLHEIYHILTIHLPLIYIYIYTIPACWFGISIESFSSGMTLESSPRRWAFRRGSWRRSGQCCAVIKWRVCSCFIPWYWYCILYIYIYTYHIYYIYIYISYIYIYLYIYIYHVKIYKHFVLAKKVMDTAIGIYIYNIGFELDLANQNGELTSLIMARNGYIMGIYPTWHVAVSEHEVYHQLVAISIGKFWMRKCEGHRDFK